MGAVVTLSTQGYGADDVARFGGLGRAVLLVHGDKDRVLPSHISLRLYEKAAGHNKQVRGTGGWGERFGVIWTLFFRYSRVCTALTALIAYVFQSFDERSQISTPPFLFKIPIIIGIQTIKWGSVVVTRTTAEPSSSVTPALPFST